MGHLMVGKSKYLASRGAPEPRTGHHGRRLLGGFAIPDGIALRAAERWIAVRASVAGPLRFGIGPVPKMRRLEQPFIRGVALRLLDWPLHDLYAKAGGRVEDEQEESGVIASRVIELPAPRARGLGALAPSVLGEVALVVLTWLLLPASIAPGSWVFQATSALVFLLACFVYAALVIRRSASLRRVSELGSALCMALWGVSVWGVDDLARRPRWHYENNMAGVPINALLSAALASAVLALVPAAHEATTSALTIVIAVRAALVPFVIGAVYEIQLAFERNHERPVARALFAPFAAFALLALAPPSRGALAVVSYALDVLADAERVDHHDAADTPAREPVPSDAAG